MTSQAKTPRCSHPHLPSTPPTYSPTLPFNPPTLNGRCHQALKSQLQAGAVQSALFACQLSHKTPPESLRAHVQCLKPRGHSLQVRTLVSCDAHSHCCSSAYAQLLPCVPVCMQAFHMLHNVQLMQKPTHCCWPKAFSLSHKVLTVFLL